MDLILSVNNLELKFFNVLLSNIYSSLLINILTLVESNIKSYKSKKFIYSATPFLYINYTNFLIMLQLQQVA